MSNLPQWQWKDARAMLKSSTNMQDPQHFQEILSILNRRNTGIKTKGITKSFRLDEDILTKLTELAKNNKANSEWHKRARYNQYISHN
jgi:hypothetical protein